MLRFKHFIQEVTVITLHFAFITEHPSQSQVVFGCAKKPPTFHKYFHHYLKILFRLFGHVSAMADSRVQCNSQTITEVIDMQLDITGHQLEVTEPIKNYIDTKFERIKRHFDQVMSVHVILSVEKIRHKSEATMHIGGKDFFAESTEDHLYKSIDALVDKLDKQIRRHKSKLNNYNNKEAIAINRTQY